ncbi:MAG TPA: MBL fold metallo-hydrolase [Gemmatimonadales bacterium]|nr:MBL fold metallo-hydrolase [Gemmatimonadales bacterium]
MSLVHTFSVGRLRCHTLEAGLQRLDGGAMFGVVPRPLWEKRAPPDERHRIPLALRCLLVEHPDGPVLIDTGVGDKENPKFHDIYGIENAGDPGPTRLEDGLAAVGVAPDDVRLVVNTHLHFDHAGGNTRLANVDAAILDSSEFAAELAFPNATYVVQRGDLEFARRTNERTRASYLPKNFEPVSVANRWRLFNGDGEVVPGIALRVTPGHVPYHQCIVVRDGGESAVFLADLVPTAAHLPLPWIMGYDLEPLRTLESKRALLEEAASRDWLLVFEHDPVIATARLERTTRGLELRDEVRVATAAVG